MQFHLIVVSIFLKACVKDHGRQLQPIARKKDLISMCRGALVSSKQYFKALQNIWLHLAGCCNNYQQVILSPARKVFLAASAFGQHQTFPPNARKTQGATQRHYTCIPKSMKGVWQLGIQNNAALCLSKHKTTDSQCPNTTAQSNLY